MMELAHALAVIKNCTIDIEAEQKPDGTYKVVMRVQDDLEMTEMELPHFGKIAVSKYDNITYTLGEEEARPVVPFKEKYYDLLNRYHELTQKVDEVIERLKND